MTDDQFLLSIRVRSSKRPSNFLFTKILLALGEEAKHSPLERDVLVRFADLCAVYGVTLDTDEMRHMMTERVPLVTGDRQKRLNAVGFGV